MKTVKQIGGSPMVSMGTVRLRQPLPSPQVSTFDPFILLHHYGPYAIGPFNNPFDLGPHPHRGFEPITLLYKGEQLHRDSLGNESVVKAGDVQWTTAGRGIIHAEGPRKEWVQEGGELEGIQLWLNLPKDKKMMTPNYQHIKSEAMEVVTNEEGSISIKVVAGNLNGKQGKIKTQTDVNVLMGVASGSDSMEISIVENHETLIYLLDGALLVNDEHLMKKGATQMLTFNQDGTTLKVTAKGDANFLVLSGTPLKEPVAQYGPYVMNTQTEILEALRDYQMGKMGFLAD